MPCPCATCPKRGTAKCEKERLKFDVEYFRDLLKRQQETRDDEFPSASAARGGVLG